MKYKETLIFLIILIISVVYLKSTQNIFSYCLNKNKITFRNDSLEEACDYLKYIDHSGMKYLLYIIYEDLSENNLKDWIMKNNIYTVRNTLKIIKFMHLLLYIMSIYLLFRLLPNKILQILIYLANKVSFVVFIILSLDAIIYVYYDIQIDILYIINYLNTMLF